MTTWIASDGGPLVLVPAANVTAWNGPEGHYDLATEIPDELGVLDLSSPAGPVAALVIGDEPLRATYLPQRRRIARWAYGDSEDVLLTAADGEIPRAAFEEGPTVHIAGEALLFDAAVSGDSLAAEETLTVALPPGWYRLRTAEVSPDERTLVIVHELTATS